MWGGKGSWQPWHGPILKAPIPLGVVPPTEEEKTTQWKEVWPQLCEAHQKALATVATLEEEIERLSCTRNCSQLRARSKSRDHWWQSREGQKRRHCQVWFEDHPAPQPLCWPQKRTWWAGVQWQRLWLGGATGTEADGSLLPERVARDFWRWRQGDASRAHSLRV